jgi:hypothetical protein
LRWAPAFQFLKKQATWLASQATFDLAVDDEQNTGNQRANSRDDAQYSAYTYTKKVQAHDDQEDSEQDPFQLIHVHCVSPLSYY